MSGRKIAAGPGASSLILIAVLLALCVLAVLTALSAGNEASLGDRGTVAAEQAAQLSAGAELTLSEIDAMLVRCAGGAKDESAYLTAVLDSLPDGMTLREGQIFWNESGDGRTLMCGIRILPPGTEKRYEWTRHKLVSSEESWEDDWE